MIKSSLYESEKIMDCSSDTVRLLFVWLCLSVDDDGKMQYKARSIKSKFFGYRDSIKISACEKMVQELAERELIFCYKEKATDNAFIEIPKWTCVNSIRKDCYKPSEILDFSESVHEPLHSRNTPVTGTSHSIVKISKDKVSLDKSRVCKIKYAENVYLKESEYNKILGKYFNGNEDLMKLAIDKLDAYKLSSGKPYKSDAGAIRSWVADKIIKEVKSSPENKYADIIEWAGESNGRD